MATIIRTLKDLLGNQIIPRTKTSAVSLSDGSLLNTYEDYIRGGGGIKPQIVVTAPEGSVVTCTDGTVTFTGISTGTYTFYLPHFGTYTVSSVLEYQTSPIQTIVVDTVTIYHVTLVYFSASIQVTAPEGSSLTCRSGATTLTGTSTGVYTFSVKTPGTWTITATLNNKTVQKVVEVSDVPNQSYNITLVYYVVYGVRIDTTNSNPLTSVSYIQGTEAYGMTKGSSDWDTKSIFNTIKPCLMVNGTVTEYLNPNNYAQNTAGNAVDISSNSTGDVMVEFGKGGYKFVQNGNYLDIYVTDDPDASADGYVYHPFSYATEGDCEHFWWGAYMGYLVSLPTGSTALRSRSGNTIKVNSYMTDLRNSARALGTGYYTTNYFQLLWVQILYLVKYGNLNAQAALGGGATATSSIGVTGSTNTLGMNYGTPNVYTNRMKLFGIEDFYGNAQYFIDGIYYDSDYTLKLAYPSKDYSEVDEYNFSIATGNLAIYPEGYIKSVIGTNETGFIAKEAGGSATTYYADRMTLTPNRYAYFGGSTSHSDYVGSFRLIVDAHSGIAYADVGARLSYCLAGK